MPRYSDIIIRCVKNVHKSNTRSLSFASVKELLSPLRLKQKSTTKKPPYNYICHVGDPVLRQKATPIDLRTVEKQTFQQILEHLRDVMKERGAVGLSAPQIGLPWQLFAIEITEKALKQSHSYYRNYNIETCPLTYFINPKLKVTNPEKIVLYEMCGSIPGYCAEVARVKEVQIEAYNRLGEPFCWKAKDFLARIAQHEFDHLQGRLFIDIMVPGTFKFLNWESVK
ncbi:Peptide deformylase, mitochondrial [Anthophora retusa]